MKKTVLGGLLIILAFSLVRGSVLAKESRENLGEDFRNSIRPTIVEAITEGISPTVVRNQIKNEVRNEVRENEQENNEGLFTRIKNFIKKTLRFDARITGTIASLGTNTFTVSANDGKTYTINVTDQTRYVRRFGGKSSFSEMNSGDTVDVFGKFTNSTNTTINASVIRDLSIQKRWGVFFGDVTVKNSDNFVMATIERGNQTVYFSSTTKFISHDKSTITYNDLNVGDRVRVEGVWDKTTNKISEVDEVRVFPKPNLTKTPEATETPGATVTPTP